jgi:EAL and modified HD-GYP domain-containing signal transduction protein
MTSEAVLVGRQPIYQRHLELFAYELLYRNGNEHQANVLDGDQATAQVLLNAFIDIGLEQVIGDRLAFINLTRGFILGDYCHSLPKDRVVLEVLEDIAAEPRVVESLRRLSARGYLIALDDFMFREDLRPLVAVANIVKLDVLALDRQRLAEHAALLRRSNVRLLAEKVETHEDYEFCKQLGFDYFQGYFFCRPNVVSGSRLPVNRLAVLRLLAELQNPEAEAEELEQTILLDPSLSYRLLRYANSALHALPQRVQSIRQAMVLVGTERIRSWASLVMLSGVHEKPRELLVSAILRAKMCELLAQAMKCEDKEKFSTVGLFSVLDALFDKPMSQVLESLPLAEEVTDSLLGRPGILGNTLHCVTSYEQGRWGDLHAIPLSDEIIRDAYLASVAWSEGVVRELGFAGPGGSAIQ